MRPAALALSACIAAGPNPAFAQTPEESSQEAARSFHDPAGAGAVAAAPAVPARIGLKEAPATTEPAGRRRTSAEVRDLAGRRIVDRSDEYARTGAAIGTVCGGVIGFAASFGNPLAAAAGATVGGVIGGAVVGWVGGWIWGKSSYNRQVNDAIYERHQSAGQRYFGDPFPR